MLRSADPEARELARSHSAELGGPADTWTGRQRKGIFNALSKRNHRENTLLYPVADALP
jgi:hypothetical protein